MGESAGPEDIGEGTSRGEGAEGPVIRKGKSATQKRRMEARRREREGGPPIHAGGTQTLNPKVAPNADQAEALGESELDEEARRMEKEEEATLPAASSEGEVSESEERLTKKRGAKKGNKKKRAGEASTSLEWDDSIPLTLSQVPAKGRQGTPPLIDLSNKYSALVDLSGGSEEEGDEEGVQKHVVEPLGGNGASSSGKPPKQSGGSQKFPEEGKTQQPSGSGGGMSQREGTGRVTENSGRCTESTGAVMESTGMDVSVSLKRLKPEASDEEEGRDKGKKKAVELDHQ